MLIFKYCRTDNVLSNVNFGLGQIYYYYLEKMNITCISMIFILDKLETVLRGNRKPPPLFKSEFSFSNILRNLGHSGKNTFYF